jgi:hypothetical protein
VQQKWSKLSSLLRRSSLAGVRCVEGSERKLELLNVRRTISMFEVKIAGLQAWKGHWQYHTSTFSCGSPSNEEDSVSSTFSVSTLQSSA